MYRTLSSTTTVSRWGIAATYLTGVLTLPRHLISSLHSIRCWLASSAFIASCGGGGDIDNELAFRVIHASPDSPPVNILVDGVALRSGLGHEPSSFWPRIARAVMAQPVLIGAAVVALLLLCAAPFLRFSPSIADARAGCHIHLDELIAAVDDPKVQVQSASIVVPLAVIDQVSPRAANAG